MQGFIIWFSCLYHIILLTRTESRSVGLECEAIRKCTRLFHGALSRPPNPSALPAPSVLMKQQNKTLDQTVRQYVMMTLPFSISTGIRWDKYELYMWPIREYGSHKELHVGVLAGLAYDIRAVYVFTYQHIYTVLLWTYRECWLYGQLIDIHRCDLRGKWQCIAVWCKHAHLHPQRSYMCVCLF